ncbi:hypothetical protein JOE61_002014 [Nocardioides salarius]|uniref:Protein-glutamine gamma-glutamyltransferase-like C-terminal domain-containing protein n=1 Tax=Nocardioides salarius TaxID=374513 RepID=A0ABS2MAJ9_9ACTN|nr:DUF4129 domain-containing protein [Nocardioides salarius]MBM7508200.1 hypothetical protein [Nocardioides salarius]
MASRAPSTAAARTAVVAVAGCTLVVLLLAVWAASTGPGEVLRGDGPGRVVLPSSTATTPSLADLGAPGERPPPRAQDQSPLLGLLASVLVGLVAVALGLAVVVGTVLAVRHLLRLRPPAAEPGEHVDFEVLDAPSRAALRDALAADLEEQLRELRHGTPRNAVVASWQRFEELAAAAGVPRRESETSSELAQRVLDLAGVDAHAVNALAEEFRAARFSRHEVGEDARVRVLALLEEVHAGLGPRPGVRPGVRPGGRA